MATSTTDIEKKSLEAHVELCAERYSALENKLHQLTDHVTKLEAHVIAIKENLAGAGDKTSKQIIAIGTAIVSVLITGIITLTVHLVAK